jgi:hypothetical protein
MKRTRLFLLGAMLVLISMVSWTQVEATTCQVSCMLAYDQCVSGCHGLGTCRTICGEALTICENNCAK